MDAPTNVLASDYPVTTGQRLLAAAELLVLRQGVHALTVRRIADTAGVNSALIRYHFGSTSGLLADLARRNANCIADARVALLSRLASPRDFDAAVDALVLPLWAAAALHPDHRAIVVLDEIFSRADPALHREIWTLFTDGVAAVTDALARCLPGIDPPTLRWRIRFVTAAALDVPPRSPQVGKPGLAPQDQAEQREQFRAFAAHALRT